jgi:hypothetical protein
MLFITGYAQHAMLNNANLPPGMRVLAKPFAIDTLASRLKNIVVEG